MINTRSKGMRNERRGCAELLRQGYKVFRLYQPRGTPQGEFDMIAVGFNRIRFVQVRTNSYHNLRPMKEFAAIYATHPLTPSRNTHRSRRPS